MPVRTLFLWLSAAFSIGCLSLFLIVAFYFPASGDDYWGAHFLAIHGFWGMNLYQMTHWGARYTSTFLSLSVQYLIGLEHYWFTALSLFVLTIPAFYYLFCALLPETYPRNRVLALSLILMVLDMLIAKPGADGGAALVLAGQYYWNAGAYCYQISVVLLCVILGSLARDRYKLLTYCSMFLICGTNEGAAIMLLLITIYGMWQNFNTSKFTTWFWLFFALVVNLGFLYLIPGLQIRVYYYHLKPNLYPLTNDWVLATQLAFHQTIELFFYYLINPVLWLMVWVLFPEIDMIRIRLKSMMPMLDVYLIFMGLVFVGFFAVGYAMGIAAVPRYYSLMALIALFGAMLFLCSCAKRLSAEPALAFLIAPKVSLMIAMLCLAISIVTAGKVIPNFNNAIAAIKQGPLFMRQYNRLEEKLVKAKEQGLKQIKLLPAEFLPNTPILNYTFLSPQLQTDTIPSYADKQREFVKGMGYFYFGKKLTVQ